MGMDLIGIGYTVDRQAKLSAVNAKLIVLMLRTEIEPQWELIDIDGSCETPEEVFSSVMKGAEVFAQRDSARMSIGFPIPGHDDRDFYFAGGGSWGDEPFDGFNDLCNFISACQVVPGLGQSLGVLGGGIRTD